MPTALITGASSGIGLAFAQELAARNHNLVLVARSEAKLQQLAAQLQNQYKIAVEVLVQDLTEPSAPTAIFEAVTRKEIAIDLLINNAGFGDYGAFAEKQRKRHLEMIQLNVMALVDLTHQFLVGMRQRQSGSIINIASIAAFQPLPYLSVYAATKAFVLSFSEALWAENKSDGIKVLVVCPGPTETEFFKVAEFPQSFVTKTRNYASSEEVVRESLIALEKNQPTVVTGDWTNQAIVNLPRFLPREVLLNAVEKQFRN